MKSLWALLLATLLLPAANAQTSPTSSLLWEISGNGLQQPSYIFGTFHMICRTEFEITDILKSKIASSQQFYGELAMDDPKLQMQMAMKLMMPDKSLSSLMGESDYKKVSENFQAITGMSLQMFDNFKPFVPLSLLALNGIACDDKMQPETEFVAIAKQNQMPILGLETVDDQVNAIDKEPLDSQVLSLKQMLLNFDSVKNMMQEMMAIYKKRDIDSLYAFMKIKGDKDFETALLVDRNRNWVPIIEKAVTAKASFFAVGAGHLGGTEGVISLLRKRGYQVIPVKY